MELQNHFVVFFFHYVLFILPNACSKKYCDSICLFNSKAFWLILLLFYNNNNMGYENVFSKIIIKIWKIDSKKFLNTIRNLENSETTPKYLLNV